ncbi:MAG TPA: pilus assembly protein PilM [Verrucomicrobiae bacterium]
MIASLTSRKLRLLNPPVRRVLAVDLGSRRLKLVLAESDFGRFRVLKQELLDLKAEGLVSAEELKTHLRASLDHWGTPAVAIVLPEHLSISQVIDLPNVPESDVEKLIQDETIKLSGVAESRVVYDFVRTEALPQDKQQFWVTLGQEENIRERIQRLGLERDEVCEVTTTANALIASYRAAAPLSSRAILVQVGAQSTIVVILLAGQPAFATSFQMGGDFFTRALARERNCPEEAAEALKKESNLLSGVEASRALAEAVDGWAAELKRQLNEWFQEHPALAAEVRSFELIASGGALQQPGLSQYLQADAALEFHPWPATGKPEGGAPTPGFEIALGAALQALGHAAQPVSLLPLEFRSGWNKRLSRSRIELASCILLAVCLLLLAVGTWHNVSLYTTKKALRDKVRAGQSAVDANEALTADLMAEYENLRPLVASQQNTLDTLKSLALIQQSCSKSNFWYALLADQQSYFSRPPAVLSTNRPAKTNLLGPTLEALRPMPLVSSAYPVATTNLTPAKPGLIAELCVPGGAETSRQFLSELVNGWKQQSMFSKVDLLSEDLRRNLADPKVIVAERDYVLALDFAETDFHQAVRARKAPSQPSRRPARPAPVSPDRPDNMPRNGS